MGCNSSKLDDEEAVKLCKDRKKYIKQAVEHHIQFVSSYTAYIESLRRVSAALGDYIQGNEPTTSIQSESKTCVKISYYQPSGNPVISVEERLQSPETAQILNYSPFVDGFLAMQQPSFNPAYFPHNRPNASPQNNQWEFFWNPFTQLDSYEYPTSGLEEETAHTRTCVKEEVIVEDVGKDEDNDACKNEEVNETKSDGNVKVELSQSIEANKVEVCPQETNVEEGDLKEQTPGFTIYVNQRPTSMEEIIKDLDLQFMKVCSSAKQVSSLLESSHTKNLSPSHEISPLKMLNPVALFRSGSRDNGESSTGFSAKSCMFYGTHQSTLDRLYAWEKRLYEEVRSAERIRQAYEKKCKQLANRDVEGEDPSFVQKTKATIRDLYTQMNVAMHTIETISIRIETLRDEELHPQILELLQGLAGMWKVMAECHEIQKCTIDDAKLLLAGGKLSKWSKSRQESGTTPANWVAQSALNLETELRNWRSCFESWITSERSYIESLVNWVLTCMPCDAFKKSELPSNAPPILGICIQWSRHNDKVSEVGVLDGLEFFAAGMHSIYAHQMKVCSRRPQQGSIGYEEAVEEEAIETEKVKELGTRVLCAGMSKTMSSLADFAMCSAQGFAQLVNQCQIVNCPPPKSH